MAEIQKEPKFPLFHLASGPATLAHLRQAEQPDQPRLRTFMPVTSFNDAICPKSQVSRDVAQDIEMLHLDLPGTKKPPMPIRRTILDDFRDIPCFHLARLPMEQWNAEGVVFTWLLVFAKLGSKKTLHGGVSQGREPTGDYGDSKVSVSQTSLKRHIKSINTNWTEPS